MMTTIHTSAQLEEAMQQSREHPIVLYKHSATCPFAARAQEQIAEAKHDVDVYAVVVQYAKDISEEIARATGVEHASPQAIVVEGGEVKWAGWRAEIQRDKLVELAGHPGAS